MFVKILITALSATLVVCDPDYYWRPYYGTIPDDAVGVTSPYGNEVLYIGRGPYGDNGALIGQLAANVKRLTVTIPGTILGSPVRTIENQVEILCSRSRGNFIWRRVNSMNLNDLKGKVEGGYETSRNGVLYIGRGTDGVELRIGKVPGYDHILSSHQMLYVADINKGEIKIDDFEVLVFQN